MEEFNIQRKCAEIHNKFGTTKMANKCIQKVCDKIAEKAFDKGRNSVLENIPKLQFEEQSLFNKRCLVAKTLCGTYVIELPNVKLFFNGNYLGVFLDVDFAKIEAKKHHRFVIEKIIGIK